jgi:hypothetical protein
MRLMHNLEMQLAETRSAVALAAGHSVGVHGRPGPTSGSPCRCRDGAFFFHTQLPETRLPCHPNFWNSTTDVDELDQGLVLFMIPYFETIFRSGN